MNYFDEEVIKDFQNHNAELIILTEAECDLLINAISSLPFSGIQIAWKSLKGSTYLGTMESLEAQNSLVKKIISASDDDILIIGDTADNAYSIDVKKPGSSNRNIFAITSAYLYHSKKSQLDSLHII